MEKEAKVESVGAALARLRWANAGLEARREAGRKMAEGRRKARRAKKGAAK